MPKLINLVVMKANTLEKQLFTTSTHWGTYLIEKQAGRIIAVHPHGMDLDPSPIGQSLIDAQDSECRIPQPMIREGYLRKRWQSDGKGRGVDAYIPVPWDEALDIGSEALTRIKQQYGNEGIFGGSYGWSSAGRFHHAQSQLHRFLNGFGGYTYSAQTYSTAAASIIIPHIMGMSSLEIMTQAPSMQDIARHAKLVVSFGGISSKNMQMNSGGIGNHSAKDQLKAARAAGVEFVNISPVKDDVADFLEADWWPCRPNSDVALMLALAHTLFTENIYDQAFLNRYCSGFERFAPYLLGEHDGLPKDADWAAKLCDIEAGRIRILARRLASEPCLLSISWSLQRTEHGEQPYWMISTLAAMLGRIGLPGQGVGYGYGCIHNFGFSGRHTLPFKVGELPLGENPVSRFIPVARIADMLLNPGKSFDFNGHQHEYPEIKLVYWAGGNPFHHHQDLNRLRRAWARPETVIVNDHVWSATARHADIVFPATTTLEREDFASGRAERYLTPMYQVLAPYAEARDDYAIFSGLSQRLGFFQTFTEGRTPRQWIEHLWQTTCERGLQQGVELPKFKSFWQHGQLVIDESKLPGSATILERFRDDPDANPLGTPSGKIEIYSERIASFNYSDCPGHASWLEKQEFVGSERSKSFPLALVSNQPKTRLHSQYDYGLVSRKAKIKDREPARINPIDAKARAIQAGDIIRIYNDRGACLAAAVLTDRIRPGAIELPTGAWFDPQNPNESESLEVHGNPNVLTRDKGTSRLAQGTSAHSCLVEVERFDGALPEVKAFRSPSIAS
ncbi:molybdopterin-dependent oxidoreductase [Pseudomonadota bacterium]